jgi:hypothetical protein
VRADGLTTLQPQQLGWTSRSKAMLRACGTGASMGPWEYISTILRDKVGHEDKHVMGK